MRCAHPGSSATSLACVIRADDGVSCWGSNLDGALGHAMDTNGDVSCTGVSCNSVPSAIGGAAFKASALAVGSSPAAVMAELFGKETGVARGYGGSMHLLDVDRRFLGGWGIVGGHLPIAVGAALALDYQDASGAVLCQFGDGATNTGAFHEALNLAAVWKLPVVFVCENNRYMEYTPIASVTSVANPAADRAAANGMPGVLVDGNDVVAVHDIMSEAVRRARDGEGPAVIEALTYRHFGHSRTDPATYRPQEEVEEWLARDPLLVARAKLRELGATDDDVDAADARAAEVVAEASRAAQAAPAADPEDALTDVWADGGWAWRT